MCVDEAFEQDKLDIKGKGKEHSNVGGEIVDLTQDNNDHGLENADDRKEDIFLIRKLLAAQISVLSFWKHTVTLTRFQGAMVTHGPRGRYYLGSRCPRS